MTLSTQEADRIAARRTPAVIRCDPGRRSTPERLGHHLLATLVLFLVHLARHGLACKRSWRARHVPAARKYVLLRPPFGVMADIVVADLLNLGGVFGDEAVRLDEIREHIAAG